MQTMLEISDIYDDHAQEYLLQQVREGDEQAVEAYVQAYYSHLLRLALLTSPEKVIAREAVQVTLLNAPLQYSGDVDGQSLQIYLLRELVRDLDQHWDEQIDADGLLGAIARLDSADRWSYLLSTAANEADETVLEILEVDRFQLERRCKRAVALLEVDGFGQEQIETTLQSRSLPDFEALQQQEENLAAELHQRIAADRSRRKQRLIALELVWAILGLSILILGYSVFSSIEVAAISSQETPIAGSANPTTEFGPFLPSATPFPYEATQANGRSSAPAISQDGRYIVYVSEATNLVPDDSNGVADVFLFDRVSESTTLISQGLGGLPADGASGGPSISADGRLIAFTSFATNLVAAPKNLCLAEGFGERPCADVYLYDRESATILPITQSAGQAGNGDSGVNPWGVAPVEKTAISADGQVLAYYSRAENFGADPLYGGLYIFLLDTEEQIRIDVTPDEAAVNGSSFWPSLSQDGGLLAFTTLASNLVSDDTNNQADIFVYDRLGERLVRITAGPLGTGADGASVMPALSTDARWLAFRSEAADLVEGDFNDTADIFLHDLQAGITRLVSANEQGTSGNRASNWPAVSAGGHITAFTSLAGDLVDQTLPGSWDVFIFNRLNNNLQRATIGLQGQPTDGPSAFPQISGDGLFVVFSSAATNLVEEDLNGVEDIFLYQRESGLLKRVNLPPG